MTDRRVKECIIFNPETGISEDGTMHDGVYRQWINQPKKEQEMTRKESIEQLKNIKSVPSMFIDETIKELVEALKQPPTLCDFLGWEEGQEYVMASGGVYKIEGDELLLKFRGRFGESAMKVSDMKLLRQAKKVEKKSKDGLLDELQELVSSERINDIIKQLREVE